MKKHELKASPTLPHWFPEVKILLILMGGSGIRPLISKVTKNTVKVRYPSRMAYQDPAIIRRLYNVLLRNKLAVEWSSTPVGMYITIGPEPLLEEQTGAQI